jgi:BirA family biotin operon repressor/biotin-[acetyl-CoA-carboxylase] ligase
MRLTQLEESLADLPLGGVRYFDCVGSTNDVAAQWVAQTAPDLALVVADEQTTGRGRAGRHWYTPPGSALAFSLVMYPTLEQHGSPSRLTALGALAVCEALKNRYQLLAKIKWPNDVLVGDKKVAGVLAEAQWTGGRLSAVILGIGINVAPASVEAALAHETELRFPATSVESALGRPVDRLELLHAVVAGILNGRKRLGAPDFLQDWEANLAYRHEWVQVLPGGIAGEFSKIDEKAPASVQEGQVIGLSKDGSLKLQTRTGEVLTLPVGEVRLRPVKPGMAEEVSHVR